ncbi:MAG TPA: cyclic nucleotide-binding domain-containing protein, partial [Chryseosolibacter sp.]
STDLYKILCPHKVKDMRLYHEFVTYRKGDPIYQPGTPSTHIYLIAEGRVKVGHYGDNNEEIITSIYNAFRHALEDFPICLVRNLFSVH